MSQYHSPYTLPNPQYPINFNYYQPQLDVLAPARRASTMMYVVGGLTAVTSLCCAGVASVLPRLLQERPELFDRIREAAAITPEQLRLTLFVLSGLAGVAGLVMLVLSPFVRKGGLGATIGAIIMTVPGLLYFGISLLSGFGRAKPDEICMSAVPLAMFGLLLIFLIQAARASGRVRAMQQQYAMQYWQYQQQQAPPGSYPPPPGGTPPIPPPPPNPPA